jgi:hypothetical protein
MWPLDPEGTLALRRSRNYRRLVVTSRLFLLCICVGAVAYVVALGARPLSRSLGLFGLSVVAWMLGMAASLIMTFALARLKDEYGVGAIGSRGRRALLHFVGRDVLLGGLVPPCRD